MRSVNILVIILATMLFLSCENCETCSSDLASTYDNGLFRIDSTWLPSAYTDRLSISASGTGVVDSTWNVMRDDLPLEIRTRLKDSGGWVMSLEAWSSDLELLVAEATESFSQDYGLIVLNLDWQITSNIISLYTFQDIQLSGWGGTAFTSLQDGVLQLSSTGQTAWYYHIFDHAAIGEYTSLVAQFDLLFADNYSYMGFRAHASNGWLDWGPEILFHDGNIIAHLHGDNITTQIAYETDVWYRFRLSLDNSLGDQGRYKLEMKERGSTSYTDFGDYDYYAYDGRPIDIVEIAFGVHEAVQESGKLTIDNVVILEP